MKRAAGQRHERGLAVAFAERLSGSYRDRSERDRPLSIELRARSSRGEPFGRFVAGGRLSADGIATNAELSGSVVFSLRGSLAYDLSFTSPSGERLRLLAHKRDLYIHPYAAFTTLRGALVDAATGDRIALVAARFDARGDVGWWLKNVRLLRA